MPRKIRSFRVLQDFRVFRNLQLFWGFRSFWNKKRLPHREPFYIKVLYLFYDKLADGVGALAGDADEVGALGHASQVNFE